MHGAKLRCVALATRRERTLRTSQITMTTRLGRRFKLLPGTCCGGVHPGRTRSTRTTAHPRSKSISPERRPSTHRVDGCRATALRYLQKVGGPPGRRPALSGLGRPSWCVKIWGVYPFVGILIFESRVERWRGGLGSADQFPALSFAGASLAVPCSVSTSRSSNRTCGFPASGFPTSFTRQHTMALFHFGRDADNITIFDGE